MYINNIDHKCCSALAGAHDARIFLECNLKQRFENGEFRHYVLLGDGGYKCTKYLMTPVLLARCTFDEDVL